MSYTIMRVKKLKSAGAIKAVGEHLARQRATQNADPERECRTLVGTVDPWIGVQQRMAVVEAPIRKNAVLACEVFVGASPDYFRPKGGSAGTWDDHQLQAWIPTAIKSITKEWGAENVVTAYLHLDEATPHIQAIVVPITPDTNKLNASHWLDGRKALSQLQDRHAEDMKPLGLERGIRGSEATHTEVREWYGQMHAAIKGVPTPRVQSPPLQVTGRTREEWAEQETERLKDTLREPLLQLQTQARAYQEAEKKRAEREATAKRLAKELEESKQEITDLQKIANLVRGVPLSQVASYFDPEELEEAGIRIGKDKDGRERIFNADGKVVGRNGIDLVIQVTKEDFAGAVTWLAGRAGPAVAQKIALNSAIETTLQVVEQSRSVAVSSEVMQKRLDLSIERGRKRKISGYRSWSTHMRKHGFTMQMADDSLSFMEVFSNIMLSASEKQISTMWSSMQDDDWDPTQTDQSYGPSR